MPEDDVGCRLPVGTGVDHCLPYCEMSPVGGQPAGGPFVACGPSDVRRQLVDELLLDPHDTPQRQALLEVPVLVYGTD